MKTFSRLIVFIMIILAGCSDENIIEAPVFPPPAIEGLTAVPGNGQVTLNWANGNNALFNYYSLIYSPSDGQPIRIPNTESTYTVNGLANDTEYTFTLVAQRESQATEQSSDPVSITATPFEPNTSGPELSSFSFLAANNTNMALEEEDIVDLVGTIDQENNTVVFSEEDVSAYVYKDALIATFEVPDGTVVSVNGEEQVSGETVQDFSSAITYDFTADGITRTYTITVNKSHFALIPDDAFRARLAELGMPFDDQDRLDIGSTTVTEYETDGKIDLDNFGISNIKGIEFFVGVKEIDAERNSFPSIDLSRNAGLKNLLVGLNATIGTIEVGDKTDLEILYANDAPMLTDVVLQPIINSSTGLKRLFLQGVATGFNNLDVGNLTSMERLRFSEPTAVSSAASINSLLAKNPPIASDLGNLRIYNNETGEQCDTFDPATYQCNQ